DEEPRIGLPDANTALGEDWKDVPFQRTRRSLDQLEYFALEPIGAAVDDPRARSFGTLREMHDPRLRKRHRAVPAGIGNLAQCHLCKPTPVDRLGKEVEQIEVEQAVAIEQQKLLVEYRCGVNQRTGRASGLRFNDMRELKLDIGRNAAALREARDQP